MRWGAVVLDVVGNDTAVGQELIEDDPAALATAKRREADVRELYTRGFLPQYLLQFATVCIQ